MGIIVHSTTRHVEEKRRRLAFTRESAGGRRVTQPRGGISRSLKRALSDSSKSLRVGRAWADKRRHSSNGTSTAAPAPRLVTSCGPSRSHATSNSLNLAFASFTGQRFIASLVSRDRHVTRFTP